MSVGNPDDPDFEHPIKGLSQFTTRHQLPLQTKLMSGGPILFRIPRAQGVNNPEGCGKDRKKVGGKVVYRGVAGIVSQVVGAVERPS